MGGSRLRVAHYGDFSTNQGVNDIYHIKTDLLHKNSDADNKGVTPLNR